jgi:ketosteroid isomerase-like protein
VPDANAAIVRRIYKAWNSGGLDALAPHLAETVELQDAPQMPDAETVAGREAVLARLHEVAAAMGGGSVDPRELESSGEAVLVPMLWRAGPAAGSAEFGEVFHVVRLAGEQIASMRVFVDADAAREEARAQAYS